MSKQYLTQVSNPSAEEHGWLSPQGAECQPDATRISGSPTFSQESQVPEFLEELDEVLVDYCHQLLAYWWSNAGSVSEERRKEARRTILGTLDHCHAHEVLFILNGVRLRDQSLVPKLQEQILDLGVHQRLVTLLAHMYQ